MSQINALDILAVKNVIARYCEALDTKDFTLLEDVFVKKVSADYPFNPDLQGVEAVAQAIENRYQTHDFSFVSSSSNVVYTDWVLFGRIIVSPHRG